MPPAPEPAGHDAFESVLAKALVAGETEGPEGLRRVVDEHPDLADRLREHLGRLRNYGLIEKTQVAGGARSPLAPAGPGDGRDFPAQLGDFRLLQRIGGGGMGVVYLAEQQSLRRRVALKLVRSEHLYFPDAAERFRREVEALAKLQHPGIVPVFQAGEDAGVPWLAMEHVVGASLDEVVRGLTGRDPARLTGQDLRFVVRDLVRSRQNGAAGTAAPATEARDDESSPFAGSWVDACLRVVRAVAQALQHAHERGVLHRDVKPSNVMLTLDGRALLLDFGLARADGSIRLTGTGSQLGSPAYMSPEQMRDVKQLDARTDIYSLGVTLYELLTLRMPFAGESAASTRDLVLAGRPVPMRLLNRSIAQDADIVCRKAMDVDPGRRYATAAAFAADLDAVLTHRPIQARPPGPWRLARRWAQRHPARATAAAAAVLLFGVAPTVFLLQQRGANREIAAALAMARQQRDRAREAVDTMITRVANEAVFDLPRLMPVRRDLLVSARSFYERFLAEALDDPELREQTADTALQLASLEVKLGQAERALTAVTRAEELTRRSSPPDAKLLRQVLQVKGSALYSLARLEEAVQALGLASAACDQALRDDPDDLTVHAERMGMIRGMAVIQAQLQRRDDAMASHRRLQELWREADAALDDGEARTACRDELLGALADEADLHFAGGDRAGAAQALQRATELRVEAAPEPLSITARLALGRLAQSRGRIALADGDAEAAARHCREGLAALQQLLAEFPDYANGLRTRAALLNDLAMALDELEEPADETQRLYDESIATLRRLLALDASVHENRANLAASLVNRAARLLDHEPARARPLFAEAQELAEQALAATPGRTTTRTIVYNAVWFLGQACGALGDHVAQAKAAERLAALQPDDPRTQRIAAELLAQSLTALDRDETWTAAARADRRPVIERQAMACLGRAADLGCTDHEWVATSEQFAPLRALPDAAAVIARLAANARKKP